MAEDLDLEPDDDVVFRFLAQWFSSCNHGVIELGWTDERDGRLNLFRRFELEDIAAAARFAVETNARRGCSVYFRPATVRADSKYTRDDDVVQVPGCWADSDTTESVEHVLSADIMPTAQVVTGRHPALRSQFLWKFSSPPILVPDWSRELNRQAQTLAGGDPAVVNPSTLLRLPGTIAWPWKPGRVPELTEWITPNGGHAISFDALRSRLPTAEPRPFSSGNGAAADATELLNPVQALLDQARAGPYWHDPVLRLVAMLVHRNTPASVIMAMAEHLTWPNYTVAQTREELAVMIDGARRKGFGDENVTPDASDRDADDVMDVPPKIPVTFLTLSKDEIFALPDPTWLIPGFVATNTLSVLYGQFGSYKSFVVLVWALSLATGTPWCDRPIERCDVLYIAGEGVAGLKPRLAAWLQHHGVTGPVPGFRVVPLAVNLMDRIEAQRLVLTMAEANKADGFSPKLIIIDTLHRSMPGADENSAKDVGTIIGNMALVQREIGCACLAVHHAGKDTERGARGSSGIPGAADTLVRVSRTSDTAVLRVEKQKDAENGEDVHLRAQVVTLPPVDGCIAFRTSLILILDADPPPTRTASLSPIERRAKQFLADLIVAEGVPLPQSGQFPSPIRGQPLRGVKKDRWREECETRQLSTAETKGNRAAIFRRTAQGLFDKDQVAARDDWVWLP